MGLRRRWACAMAIALGMVAGASAQTVTLPVSQAIACMTPAEPERGVPAYPARELERKDGGVVRVELSFVAPDRAPKVRVLTPDTFEGLIDAVRAHVRQLRVPCLAAGAEPARIVQTYVFRPDDGRPVFEMPATDEADAERRAQAKCLTHTGPQDKPAYPAAAARSLAQGNFLVRLRFTDPATAPEATIVASPGDRHLRAAVEQFLPGYRLPCLRGEPKELDVLYRFVMEGGPRTLVEDMSLVQFLRAAESLPPAQFDFGAMGCPFDLRVTLMQPYAPHGVEQVAQANPARHDFIHWLSGVRLKLSKQQEQDLLGADFTLGVPCGTLNL